MKFRFSRNETNKKKKKANQQTQKEEKKSALSPKFSLPHKRKQRKKKNKKQQQKKQQKKKVRVPSKRATCVCVCVFHVHACCARSGWVLIVVLCCSVFWFVLFALSFDLIPHNQHQHPPLTSP